MSITLFRLFTGAPASRFGLAPTESALPLSGLTPCETLERFLSTTGRSQGIASAVAIPASSCERLFRTRRRFSNGRFSLDCVRRLPFPTRTSLQISSPRPTNTFPTTPYFASPSTTPSRRSLLPVTVLREIRVPSGLDKSEEHSRFPSRRPLPHDDLEPPVDQLARATSQSPLPLYTGETPNITTQPDHSLTHDRFGRPSIDWSIR